jgi:hypothetical protein
MPPGEVLVVVAAVAGMSLPVPAARAAAVVSPVSPGDVVAVAPVDGELLRPALLALLALLSWQLRRNV